PGGPADAPGTGPARPGPRAGRPRASQSVAGRCSRVRGGSSAGIVVPGRLAAVAARRVAGAASFRFDRNGRQDWACGPTGGRFFSIPCQTLPRPLGPAMPSTEKTLAVRERLSEVRYEIRGELNRRAHALEAAGRKLIKLNIGNPGAFGFRAPEHLQQAIIRDIDNTDPYTHQLGLPAAREALAAAYRKRGAPHVDTE